MVSCVQSKIQSIEELNTDSHMSWSYHEVHYG